MKNKIKKFIKDKGICNIADILSEFLLSFEEIFPVLCDLYSQKLIKQVEEHKIIYLEKKTLINKPKTLSNSEELRLAMGLSGLITNTEPRSKFNVEDFISEKKDFISEEYDTFSDEDIIENILYEEIFSDNTISKEEGLRCAEKLPYNDTIVTKVISIIENATKEEIEMYQNGERCPNAIYWLDKEAFEDKVQQVIKEVIIKNIKRTRSEAIVMAKDMLEKAKEDFDCKMIDIYNRVYYEFRVATEEDYNKLQKQILY